MLMEGLSDEQLACVESKMIILYFEVLKRLNTRVFFTPLIESYLIAFHGTEWYENEVVEYERFSKAEEIVKSLLFV